MRFLTGSESRRWVRSQGLAWQPGRIGLPVCGQFDIDGSKDDGESARRAVKEVCGQASQAVLVIEDHPLTCDSRRMQLAGLRAESGETRILTDAPGHLLTSKDEGFLRQLLEVCIGPGSWWNTYVYLAPVRTTMLLWESSLIDLWSDRHTDFRLLEEALPRIRQD